MSQVMLKEKNKTISCSKTNLDKSYDCLKKTFKKSSSSHIVKVTVDDSKIYFVPYDEDSILQKASKRWNEPLYNSEKIKGHIKRFIPKVEYYLYLDQKQIVFCHILL